MGREPTLDDIISVHNMTPECGMVSGKITKSTWRLVRQIHVR